MERFEDKVNALGWLKYTNEINDLKDLYSVNKLEHIIDRWTNNSNVEKFVSHGENLSYMFNKFLSDDDGIFYAFEGEKLVGVAFVSPPNRYYNYSTIEYLVVNPECHGRGIGTRMITSIKENPDYFVGKEHRGSYVAFVHGDNIASQKAFLKNKFQVVKRVDTFFTHHDRYVYHTKKLDGKELPEYDDEILIDFEEKDIN